MSNYATMRDRHLGRILVGEYCNHLSLPDEPSVHATPYRPEPRQRLLEKEAIEQILKLHVVKPTTTEWASSTVYVSKMDGSLRFCVYCYPLNAETERDNYLILGIDECIGYLWKAPIFSRFDANLGHRKIEMDKKNVGKAAFLSNHGLYRYTRTPFGLRNALAIFQREMDVVLASIKLQCAITYTKNVIIFSKSLDEHVTHIEEVLRLLNASILT